MIYWLLWAYIAIGALSIIILIGMLIFGGLDAIGLDLGIGDTDIDLMDADAAGAGPGLLSIPLILCFLAAFGGIGALSLAFGLPWWSSPVIAIGGALLVAVIVFGVVQLFLKQFASDSTVKLEHLRGMKGTVTVPIRKGSEGQIALYTGQRGRTILGAIAEEDIPINTEVIITGMSGDTIKVKRIRKARSEGKKQSNKLTLDSERRKKE